MRHPYLKISCRDGKPFLGYVYVKPHTSVVKSRQKGQIVIDLDSDGSVLGIELLAFDLATIATLRTELESLGVTTVADPELQTLLVL